MVDVDDNFPADSFFGVYSRGLDDVVLLLLYDAYNDQTVTYSTVMFHIITAPEA